MYLILVYLRSFSENVDKFVEYGLSIGPVFRYPKIILEVGLETYVGGMHNYTRLWNPLYLTYNLFKAMNGELKKRFWNWKHILYLQTWITQGHVYIYCTQDLSVTVYEECMAKLYAEYNFVENIIINITHTCTQDSNVERGNHHVAEEES